MTAIVGILNKRGIAIAADSAVTFTNAIQEVAIQNKNEKVILPVVSDNSYPVWHIFAIRSKYRDELEKHLSDAGIGTNKHYPIPIHLQDCFKNSGFKEGDYPLAEEISKTELSLPMYYGMTDDQIQYVIDAVNDFKV